MKRTEHLQGPVVHFLLWIKVYKFQVVVSIVVPFKPLKTFLNNAGSPDPLRETRVENKIKNRPIY